MKYLATLAALCLPFLLAANPSPPFRFLDGNLPEVRQMAARQGKLYFIHFAAGWCMPSQWMEEHTFRDEALSAFLEKNFLALRADVDLPEGQALKEQYGVHILPSILVFSAQGQLLGRHEGAVEPEVLLEQMQVYNRSASRAGIAGEEDILPSPRPVLAISRPALMPEGAGLPAQASFHSYADNNRRPAHRPVFTLQVGVFSSYDNAIRHCAALEKQVNYQAEIAPCRLGGQSLYKVFLGRFDNQMEAAAHLEELRSKRIEGFVKIVDE